MSRRRPYLDLKQSILKLFKTTARFLHDQTARESIFEKPYLDSDYRAMHLAFPKPDWPSSNIEGGDIPKRPKTWTYVWDPGICGLGTASPDCGEEFTIPVSIGLLPPGTIIKSFEITAHSSNSDCIQILGADSGLGETGGTIRCKASTECTEEKVTICASAKLVGEIRDTLQVPVPAPFDRGGVLDYRVAASIPALVDTTKKTGFTYNCGCIDIALDCCGVGTIAWDDDNSASSISAPGSAQVYITDTVDSAPYTWTVSGTGFWTDGAHSKTVATSTGLSITIYADADSCGLCTINVVNCDGSSQTVGYVAGTSGQWGAWINGCALSGTWDTENIVVSPPNYYAEYTKQTAAIYQYQRIRAGDIGNQTTCLVERASCATILANACWEDIGEWECLSHHVGSCSEGVHMSLSNQYLRYKEWECGA